jgi:hypothetical protein
MIGHTPCSTLHLQIKELTQRVLDLEQKLAPKPELKENSPQWIGFGLEEDGWVGVVHEESDFEDP